MINQYVIYGERHSGTKFLEKLIRGFQLEQNKYFGHKHFFRPHHILNSDSKQINQTLFLCIVRNPYDWIMAFHSDPHHCGILNNKDIYRFMSKEWISRQPFLGPEILEDRHLYLNRRYNNVYEMRSVKLNYLKNILPIYVKNYIFVRYEDFLQPHFTTLFVKNISNTYNICFKTNTTIEKFRNKKYYYHQMNNDIIKYMNAKIYWNTEYQLGYKKATSVNELIQ